MRHITTERQTRTPHDDGRSKFDSVFCMKNENYYTDFLPSTWRSPRLNSALGKFILGSEINMKISFFYFEHIIVALYSNWHDLN